MTRKEIAKELERRQKNLEHLLWVASTKLTKSHKQAVTKEIAEEQRALVKLREREPSYE